MDSTGHQPAETGSVVPPTQFSGTAVALPPPSRQAYVARIGLIGIAAAAFVAVALLIFSSTASPDGTLAAGTSNGTAGGSIDLPNGAGPRFRDDGMFGFGGITIAAINGNSIALKTSDGWTRTITVDGGTTYRKGGATISLNDLKVGDQVGFRETHQSNGTWTIDSIVVILPHAGGVVTKVSGSTITVSQRDGSTATITVNGQTTYDVNGNGSATLSDVKVGMFLVAEGTRNSDGSLTASQVKAGTPGTFVGRGGKPYHFGGPGWDGVDPDSSAAPGATGSAS